MIISIHQPEYLPYIGFFYKMNKSDVMVLLDSVQFEKNDFQNRNRIMTKNGEVMLTVPVIACSNTMIKEVRIADDAWRKKHWKSIEMAYCKKLHFSEFAPFLKKVYETKWEKLSDLNVELITSVRDYLGIKTELVKSSTLGVSGKKTDLLIAICKRLGADTYLSGVGGKDYLEEEKFKAEKIKLVYSDQKVDNYLSVIDTIFNKGKIFNE